MKRKLFTMIAVGLSATMIYAATIFTGQLVFRPVDWEHQKTVGARVTRDLFGDLYDWTFTTGTNANQMQTLTVITATMTNGATYSIDITDLTNSFGDAVSFNPVRLFGATAPAANSNALEIQSASLNGWTAPFGASTTNGAIVLRPGGAIFMTAPDLTGYAVATNSCCITLSNTGTNTVSATIYIAGSE